MNKSLTFLAVCIFALVALLTPPTFAAFPLIAGQAMKTGQLLVGVTDGGPLATNTPAISALAFIPNTSYSAVQVSSSFSPVNTSFAVINGTGAITLSSTPTIATTTAISGQEITITGGTNAVTFTDNGTLSGSLLELSAATRAVAAGSMLKLRYYSGKWYEVSFAAN
jgi:hypothetical protein